MPKTWMRNSEIIPDDMAALTNQKLFNKLSLYFEQLSKMGMMVLLRVAM